MKLMIGSEGCNLTDNVAVRFGKAPYYLVFDTKTGITECYKNDREDGVEHSHQIIEKLGSSGADTLIAVHIGPHAFKIAEDNGMKVFRTEKKITVSETISRFIKGELTRLNEPTVKKHDHT